MSAEEIAVKLKPVVRFREFPFGTACDPSLREFMAPAPWQNQDRIVSYLRSGLILAYPMGADLMDWLDRSYRANPLVEGQPLGGATPLTDGTWFWYAGLIYFMERYNVRVPQEFVEHASQQGWWVNKDTVPRRRYDFSYFEAAGA
jgi:hypothetical protein